MASIIQEISSSSLQRSAFEYSPHSQPSQKEIDSQYNQLAQTTRRIAETQFAQNDKLFIQAARHALARDYQTGRIRTSSLSDKEQKLFKDVIAAYKRDPSLYPGEDGTLSLHDIEQINEACVTFPAFVRTLLERNPLRTVEQGPSECTIEPWTSMFVKFCLRSCPEGEAKHWIQIFVEHPAITDDLMRLTMDKRIGATDPQMLRMWQGRIQVKINTKFTDFDQNCECLTQALEDKINGGYGEMEFFETGALEWNAIEWGGKEEINIKTGGWIINRLPVWRTFTEQGLQARYQGHPLWSSENLPHEQKYSMVVCAARQTPDKKGNNNHSFVEIIVPGTKEGTFRVYPMGFQPSSFPVELVGKVLYAASSHDCKLHYPDENVYLSNRQHTYLPMPLTPSQFTELETFLGKFAQKGMEGREVFQPMGHNCARHVQKLYDRVVAKPFYDKFQVFAQSRTEKNVLLEIKKITKYLDDEALTQLGGELAEKLVTLLDDNAVGDIRQLITLCCESFSIAFREKMVLELPDEQIRILLGTEEGRAKLKKELSQLIQLSFKCHRFFEISVWDVEGSSDLFGSLLNSIRSISFTWLRSALLACLLFCLCAWSGYSYNKDDGTPKTMRLWNHPFYLKRVHLPSQLFYRGEVKERETQALAAMRTRLIQGSA